MSRKLVSLSSRSSQHPRGRPPSRKANGRFVSSPRTRVPSLRRRSTLLAPSVPWPGRDRTDRRRHRAVQAVQPPRRRLLSARNPAGRRFPLVSLGRGIPEPPSDRAVASNGNQLPASQRRDADSGRTSPRVSARGGGVSGHLRTTGVRSVVTSIANVALSAVFCDAPGRDGSLPPVPDGSEAETAAKCACSRSQRIVAFTDPARTSRVR